MKSVSATIKTHKSRWKMPGFSAPGNRTPAQPSHLTGFLHTFGSVFEFPHQILKSTDTFFPHLEEDEDQGDVEKCEHLEKNGLESYKKCEGKKIVLEVNFSRNCHEIFSLCVCCFYLSAHYFANIFSI